MGRQRLGVLCCGGFAGCGGCSTELPTRHFLRSAVDLRPPLPLRSPSPPLLLPPLPPLPPPAHQLRDAQLHQAKLGARVATVADYEARGRAQELEKVSGIVVTSPE